MEFWTKLFDVSDFPARWNCGRWSDAHGWLHIASDLGVWSAYFAIPCILGWFVLRRKDLPFRGVFVLFVAFILFCGATHLMDAVLFWWPAYRLSGLIKFSTAVVSWVTVAALVQIAPRALQMRTPEELEREIAARKAAEAALQQANHELERRVEARTADLAAANAALSAEQEWFKTTLASIGDAVVTTDVEGRVTTLNRVAEQLTGWKQSEAAGKPLAEVFRIVAEPGEAASEGGSEAAAYFRTTMLRASGPRGGAIPSGAVLVSKDGVERIVDDRVSPIRDPQGKTLGAVRIFRDVGERRRVELERQELAAKLSALVQNAPVAIAMFDLDLRFIDLNERCAADHGASRKDHLGKRLPEFAPALGPAIEEVMRGVLATGEAVVDLEIAGETPARPGETRWWSVSYYPVRDDEGTLLGVGAVGQETTDRKRAAQSLQESEVRFQQLADAIPNLAWMAAADGRLEWYNSRWYEYTGTTFEQMKGWGWRSVIDPDRLSTVEEKWKESLATGAPFDMVFPLRGGDGALRPFLTRVVAYRDAEGKVVRWFGTNTDVSAQAEAQEELRRIAAKLSEADRRKDEFLATLAHELRNPLAPIRTGLEVMKLARDDPAAVEKVRAVMERQTRQLIALVDDLLDVSRITRGKFELRKCRVNLADLVRNAVETSQPFIHEGGHVLTVSLPERPIHLSADPNRLAQVLSNLLNNAAKYTPSGGRIALSARREEGAAVVEVEDTGVGVPPEMQGRIFEMFAQIERPIEKGYTGLGIGLTLAKSLVELHGGKVEVESAGLDQGSLFRVRLPISEEPPREQAAAEEEVGGGGRPRRVLVVDDNQAAADMLSMVVKLLGDDVRTAGDGREAVEAAAEFRPDVVLMDLGMPKMNGYEAARFIRSQSWGGSMTLVALTGWGQDEDKQRTKEAGFDHHLVKPADPAELQRILQAAESGPPRRASADDCGSE